VASGSVTSLATGDFDGDGFPDVVVLSEPGDLSIFYGAAQGAPEFATRVAELGAIVQLAPARLGLPQQVPDAIDDLVILRRDGLTRELGYLHGGSRRSVFSPISFPGVSHRVSAALVGRFDDDDLGDAIAVVPPDMYLLRGVRTGLGGGLGPAAYFGVPWTTGFDVGCAAFAAGSFDDDRDAISVLRASGLTCASASAPHPAMLQPPDYLPVPIVGLTSQWEGRLAMHDLDADGQPELVGIIRGPESTESEVAVWRRRDDGQLAAQQVAQKLGSRPLAVVPLNVDDDDERELIVAYHTYFFPEVVLIMILKRDANGVLSELAPYGPRLRLAGKPPNVALAAADMNGDGLDDLVANAPPFVEIYHLVEAR
jgi:hypothetical protein